MSEQEDGLDREAGADERAEDDLAFGDEAPAMADEVALTDAEIGGDARIVGVRDALDGSHGARA